MKEKRKKMLLMVTIISIVFSTLATIFSGKTFAKVTNYTETNRNISSWMIAYAQAAANQKPIPDWAKENGFDITSINDKEVISFENATGLYQGFYDSSFNDQTWKALIAWKGLLCQLVSKEENNKLDDNNELVLSLKKMGINTENLKLTATVVADGKTYELDSSKHEYTEEQLKEIFEGDIIDDKTTITFNTDGVGGTVNNQTVNNIKTISIDGESATVLDKDNNKFVTNGIAFDEFSVKTENTKITKDGKEMDLFSNSEVKKFLVNLSYAKVIKKWVLDYTVTGGMDVDDANFKVVDGNNDTWILVLGQDAKCYLVNSKVFNDEFDTTLEYIAKIDEKEVGGTVENEVYKPNYDKDNIKRDADVTAIIKSKNGDNIATVNGKALDSTGKANEDGWYYPNVNDKTTIAKLYPFSKYDNSTDNGMVTEKVELGNEEGLKSNQTVSIKWPFRIIDKTYDPKDITQDTKTVTVTITTNLPMDPSKIPDGWTIVPDTDNHKITKTYNRGDNVNEDVTVYQNKTGDTANTDVTINWSGNKPSVLPQTGESIKVLALIVVCLGIAIVFVKKVKNNKF